MSRAETVDIKLPGGLTLTGVTQTDLQRFLLDCKAFLSPAELAVAHAILAEMHAKNTDAAQSIASMVTEWVEGGIRMGTDWRSGLADVIAERLARFQAPAPVDSTESLPHVIEERDSYVTELSRCRDAFRIPEPGAAHENAWMLAMGDPLAVADYVTAALAALQGAAVGADETAWDELADDVCASVLASGYANPIPSQEGQ